MGNCPVFSLFGKKNGDNGGQLCYNNIAVKRGFSIIVRKDVLKTRGFEVMKKLEEVFEGGGPRIFEDTSETESLAKHEGTCEVLDSIRSCSDSTIRELAQLCDAKECPIYHYLDALSKAGISIRFQRI